MKYKRMIQAGNRLPLFMDLLLRGMRHSLNKEVGWAHKNTFVVSEYGKISWYCAEEDIEDFEKFFLNALQDHEFLPRAVGRITCLFQELVEFSESLQYIKLSEQTNDQIIEYVRAFASRFQNALGMYSFPAFAEKVVSKLLKQQIQTHTAQSPEKLQESLQELAMPTELSDYQREHKNFLTIVKKVREDAELRKIFTKAPEDLIDSLVRYYPDIDLEIDQHLDNYAYTQVHHIFNPPTKEYYLRKITEEMHRNIDDDLSKLSTYSEDIKKRKEKILTEINADSQIRRHVDYLERLSALNDLRKLQHSKAHFLSHPLFKEIAQRLRISHIQVKQLTIEELVSTLKNKGVDKLVIKERMAFHVLAPRGEILTGANARAFVRNECPEQQVGSEVKGQVACRGRAIGKVLLVIKDSDIHNVQKGDIIVTSMTNPDMVLGMQKAAAIVTNEGGLLCHAAIVSREMGKPCLIGTETATDVFENGDVIEVNAEEGYAKILERARNQTK